MNLTEIITELIKDVQKNDFIHTVTFEKESEIDSNKGNIYPLVNFDHQYSEINGGELRLSFDVSVLLQRKENNYTNKNKIFRDNLIDNLSEATKIAQIIINAVYLSHNLSLVNTPLLTNLKYDRINLLDGVRFNLIISAPNEC